MADNLLIWNALRKVDPAQTKPFKRSGGFSGTATKPIWLTMRMTEYFGPCGIGWGTTPPEFQVINAGDEILVFCTIGLWHTKPEYLVYGVGGDKVRAMQKSGPFNSDEAFKAAHTDAIGNAMKNIGMIADVHMGRFDDSKYLRQMEEEFANHAEPARDIRAEVEKSAAWIKAQTNPAEIHRGWSDNLDWFLNLPDDAKAYLTKTRDDHLTALGKKPTASAANPADAREAWANKAIAWINDQQSMVEIQRFWTDEKAHLKALEPGQLAAVERAKEKAKQRLSGISRPATERQLQNSQRDSPIDFDLGGDQIPF